MRLARSFGTGVALGLLTTGVIARSAADYRQLRFPPMNPIVVPDTLRYEMPNGIVVYLIE